jgi:hypothetical protein
MYYPGKIMAAIGAGGPPYFPIVPGAVPTNVKYRSFGPINPFLMFIGPSGNIARAPKPQDELSDYGYDAGIGRRMPPSGWSGLGSIGSNCCAWGGNELIFFTDIDRGQLYSIGGLIASFQPWGTSGPLDIPSARVYETVNQPLAADTGPLALSLRIIKSIPARVQDETYYRFLGRNAGGGAYKNTSLLTICERCHSFNTSRPNAGAPRYRNAYYYSGRELRYYTNAELISMGGIGSGILPIFDGLAMIAPHFARGTYYGGTQHCQRFDGTYAFDSQSNALQNQTIFFQGRIYMISEAVIGVGIPASPCGYGLIPILREGVRDEQVGAVGKKGYAAYKPRTSEYTPFGIKYKCPIKYNGRLLLLQNDGKLLEVTDGKVVQLTNIIDELPTSAWASGIYGGDLGRGDNNNSYKCYGVELDGTLHFFLNYQRGNDYGVFWATTDDFVTYVDRTQMLPSSGIVPPSGFNESKYLGLISPYKFSGWENFSAIGIDGWPLGATRCASSGWVQSSGIGAEWHGSGTFLENDYTQTPDSWDIPMYYAQRTKFLAPTFVIDPAGFTPGLVPTGVGASGYRWDGVSNYHIHGVKDETEEKVHLFFTPDVINNSEGDADIDDLNPPNQTLYFTLNANNEWSFRNQFSCKRLSWVEPTDMIEPSVLLASGNYYKRFPYEDRINGVVYQPFKIYDWPFFTSVDLEIQYSLDYGANWHDAKPHPTLSCSLTGLDTGSLATDPSGTIGKDYTFAWDYFSDVGNNRKDHVQFRIRAIGY